jgi:hypothetical protein
LLPFSLNSRAFAGSTGVSCPAIFTSFLSVLCTLVAAGVRCPRASLSSFENFRRLDLCQVLRRIYYRRETRWPYIKEKIRYKMISWISLSTG